MEIIYIRSCRRTMAIEITKDLRVKVRLPLWCTKARAEKFVREHSLWIETHYQRVKEKQDRYALNDEEIKALRRRAKEVLPKRVEHFAALTGLSPTAVRITSAKTRFGSCSAKNSVNFSLYLMLYSEGAIDYVVLHELAHIKYKNHGKEFYDLIAMYMPDYKKYVKELKK